MGGHPGGVVGDDILLGDVEPRLAVSPSEVLGDVQFRVVTLVEEGNSGGRRGDGTDVQGKLEKQSIPLNCEISSQILRGAIVKQSSFISFCSHFIVTPDNAKRIYSS